MTIEKICFLEERKHSVLEKMNSNFDKIEAQFARRN